MLIVRLAVFSLAGSSGFFLDSVTSIIFWRLWLGAMGGVGVCGLVIQTGCGVLAEFSWRELFLISIIVIPLVLLYVREPVRQDEEEETGVHNGLEMSRARIKKLYTGPVLLVYVMLFFHYN